MVTIKDVAKKAYVGVGTVSRYLNDPKTVSKETIKCIEKAINELGFVPNELARSFKLRKTKTLAVLIPSILLPFYSSIAYYIEMDAEKQGYKVLLCNTNGNKEKEIYYLSLFKEQRVDGIIALTYSLIDEYVDINFPIITFDRHFNNRVSTISSDNYMGGKLAAKHLIDIGCKTIAYIGTYQNIIDFEVVKRRQGFMDEAAQSNTEYIDFIEQDPIVDFVLLANSFLDKYPNVKGVFCENDDIAMYLIKEALKREIKIPEQLNVIGFDGINDNFFNLMELTTIVQSPKLIASKMVNKIIDLIISSSEVEEIIVPIYLRKGETTK
ncbi:MAG: LacI family DNA-binding transcriptional regulator [Acholeplasmatales bacterium]|jgi:LacI family transcriptional regulator|nr:LacI family DNA-binding transcriptional regulator [Acholeplasmatales bacterium]